MPTHRLTSVSDGLWVDEFAEPGVKKRTLRGGKRDGVDLIEINNGALEVAIVPTRGMGLWKANYQGDRVGWDSPITDGPVHPSLVNLVNAGGIGWLDGFDEMMVRCGLESNGAPYKHGDAIVGLHGKIANIPAREVSVTTDQGIEVHGVVDETRLFGPALRLTTKLHTLPNSKRLTVTDTFTNLSDAPATLQCLYHWNFGPPHLEAGSTFVAAHTLVAPRDQTAAEKAATYPRYDGPVVGQPERVYFFKLIGDAHGQTVTMLKNKAGDKAIVLRFNVNELPCFTLWKNEGGLKSGYVTGLEPGTNFPNPKPFEETQGRVVSLAPGASRLATTILEILNNANDVAHVEAEIQALQAGHAIDVKTEPQTGLSAGA